LIPWRELLGESFQSIGKENFWQSEFPLHCAIVRPTPAPLAAVSQGGGLSSQTGVLPLSYHHPLLSLARRRRETAQSASRAALFS
jgi:hypothetical protein